MQQDPGSIGTNASASWIGGEAVMNRSELPRSSGQWNARRLIIVGGVVLVAASAIFAAIYYGKGSAASSDASNGSLGAIPLVSARAPGLTAVSTTIEFTGAVYARYDMPIGTEGETGHISAIHVEAGDHVHAGQLLATLDESILRPQVARLQASLDEARANSALADAEYARAEGVKAAGALSAEDIEKRKAAAVTAAAEVKVAAAQLAEYQARLSHTEIRAPADGIILTRTAEVGQIATPGSTDLFRLARDGEVEMRGLAAEQDLPSLKVGQAASVYLSGIERSFPGKVRLLGAIIDPNTRLGEVRITLQPDSQLRPGAFSRAEVLVGRGERPVLPDTAVLSDEQGTYVYVVDGSSHVQRRSVHVGDTTPQGVVITQGLTGTERVVMTAGGFLRNGEQVNVAGSAAAAPAAGAGAAGTGAG